MTDYIRNPHLEGDSFFWQAGTTGALLIHGYTATTAEVRPLGTYLHERGYTVMAPLLPGHGTTPQEMNRCQWQDWTNAVAQTYQQLKSKCERVFVCGESMGALLTLYLASAYPEIAGIVVYSPALMIANPWSMRLATVLQFFIKQVNKPNSEPSDTDARWQGYEVNPVPALVQVGKLQQAVRDRLPQIAQPMRVMQGRLDKSIDLQSGEFILREVASKNKELCWLENSMHCLILDCEWERAAEMTLNFIQKTESGRL